MWSRSSSSRDSGVIASLGLTYFKRYRMEIDLGRASLSAPQPPPGYQLLPWHATLLSAHAEAKYHSFRAEVDANVFPCLGDFDGCRRLMQEISRKDGFLPSATWLAICRTSRSEGDAQSFNGDDWSYCGTVQGVLDRSGMGAIQNLGIVPEHRGRGLGSTLLLHALVGFQRAKARRAFLEVTAQNHGAIRLYRRIGFVKARTVYKAVEMDYSRID